MLFFWQILWWGRCIPHGRGLSEVGPCQIQKTKSMIRWLKLIFNIILRIICVQILVFYCYLQSKVCDFNKFHFNTTIHACVVWMILVLIAFPCIFTAHPFKTKISNTVSQNLCSTNNQTTLLNLLISWYLDLVEISNYKLHQQGTLWL